MDTTDTHIDIRNIQLEENQMGNWCTVFSAEEWGRFAHDLKIRRLNQIPSFIVGKKDESLDVGVGSHYSYVVPQT